MRPAPRSPSSTRDCQHAAERSGVLHLRTDDISVVIDARCAARGTARARGGELLLPGEIVLEPAAEHVTPWVHAAYSARGLDGQTIQRWTGLVLPPELIGAHIGPHAPR